MKKGLRNKPNTKIVTQNVKQYIYSKIEFMTSAEVLDLLDDHVSEILDLAIENATADKRKTVMGRDIQQAISVFNLNFTIPVQKVNWPVKKTPSESLDNTLPLGLL